MLFIDNYEQYSYTKIIVPITLQESPSDYDELSYYLDVREDDVYQKDRYVGKQKIEEMKISRVENADCEHNRIAMWRLEMIIQGGKNEEEVITILNDICVVFSLKFIQYYKFFEHCGFAGFSYDRMRLERKYAYEDRNFSEDAFSMYCRPPEIKTCSTIDNKIFKLYKKAKPENEKKKQYTSAFLVAMQCRDKISRYILLYYLFEIMYATNEYQALKEKYKSAYGKERCKIDRNVILFQYLEQEFDLKEYSSLGKSIMLDAKTLDEIINTRNDLTHRGDLSKVSILMYHHMIPILQEVIKRA